MSSETSALSPFNTEQHRPTLAVFIKKTRIQNGKYRSSNIIIDIHTSHAVVTFVLFPLYSLRILLNLHLAYPKVDDFPFSIQSATLYALLWFICYAFVHPCSFGRSLSTILAGRVINHGYSFESRSGIRDVVVRDGENSI